MIYNNYNFRNEIEFVHTLGSCKTEDEKLQIIQSVLTGDAKQQARIMCSALTKMGELKQVNATQKLRMIKSVLEKEANHPSIKKVALEQLMDLTGLNQANTNERNRVVDKYKEPTS